jgi:hypothetical protein
VLGHFSRPNYPTKEGSWRISWTPALTGDFRRGGVTSSVG